MLSAGGTDRASGDTGRSAVGVAAGLGLAVWLATSAVVFAVAVGAKETCSSEVGSVAQAGTADLLLPCDLVGWLAGATTIGALLVLGLATICGAWRRWPTALVAIASVVLLQALCLVGLNSTHLL